jgi:lipopolysaccharide/colanic/teichoic acid biosynthesis glycosyltransferase
MHSSTTLDATGLLQRLDKISEDEVVPAGGAIYRAAKRVTDVVLALALICLLGPLMVVVAVLIKLTGSGPVIFRQERAGLGGRPFTMFKFRTMREGAENDREYLEHLNFQDGPVFKIREDPRITRLGGFLRKTSIDELPQLFNVLAGRMSMVGPRPLWLPEARSVKGSAGFRLKVPPGITCLWQISGRSELKYHQWLLLDLYYISHRSFLLDILIILRTIPAVISGRGAY